jgi:hypothetical protein
LRYYTRDACIAALNRFMAKAQHDAAHQLDLRSGHLLETNGSDTLAGGFVKYAVLITRPSGAATPFKFEAHLGLSRGYCSPQAFAVDPLLVGSAPVG